MPLTKVSSGVIAANAVVDSFGTQSITGDKLGLTAINANNIVNASITGAKIALGTITGDDIATGQITGNLIATNAISQNNIVSVNASVITVGTLPTARLPANSILQVVQTVKTNTFTSSATSFTDITGLTATITPSSASSRILVMASVVIGHTQNYFIMIRIAKNGSAILQGDAASSRLRTLGMVYSYPALGPANEQTTWSHQVVDSPASTSSLTYSVQTMQEAGQTQYINRLQRDDDAAYEPRSASSLILMEIAG